MENQINKKLNFSILLPILAILLGAILLVYMIVFEDEPGALPLITIVIGTLFLIKNRYQTKKQ